jgi:two-component system chemotaxis sensor kinase CheA
LLDDHERPSARDLIELIFSPGFSTAEKVTDVSGRGVGMDVVRKHILDLKGIFEIDSEWGRGTTFTLKLPLTLAIIQVLRVRVGKALFSIPLDGVVESQRIDMSAVRKLGENEVTTLRGTVVPLIRLSGYFAIPTDQPTSKLKVVIVAIGGRRVGLVVDAFEGDQEIVIKPLSDVVGTIPGISGATILGNGTISLVLDVYTLVNSATRSPATVIATHSEMSMA